MKVTDYLSQHNVTALAQFSYSPDLARRLSALHTMSYLLEGWRFANVEKVRAATTVALQKVTKMT